MRALPLTICALWFLSAACTGTSSSISVTAPTVAKCQVSVENAPSDAAPADGMTGSVAINTTRDCTWTASSNAAWLAITSAATGQGSETLTYKVSANAEPVARRGTLEVNNTQVAVAQEAAPCRYSVSPTNATVSAGGGDLAFTMETLTGCAWTAASQAAWITLPPTAAAGNRSGTLTLTVARNTAAAARSGIVTIGPQTVTIQQAAADPDQTPVPGPVPGPTPSPTPVPTPTPTPCAFDISPTSATVGSDAATGSIQVTAGAGCAWTASENTSWVTITSGTSGSGNGRVDYRVAANSGGARNATLTVAGKTFAISQAAVPPPACTFSISPTTQGFADPGGSGSIAITASVNTCAWTAATSAPWIALGANAGSGNGNVGFTVAANTALTARTGTIAVAGKTFTVSQQGVPPPPPCTFSISPTTQDNVADTGGSSSVAVTASANTCTWTAASNAPWLTVTSGASGTGNGAVGVAIAANTAAVSRSGTVTIAGQTFTVSQAAAPVPCTFSISPTTQDNVADTGGASSVAVTASANTCTWTAASNAPWLTVTSGASGTGNGAVGVAIAANTGAASRSGTVTIAGQTFTVSQAAPPPPPPCTFSISPTSQEFLAAGGSGSVTVTASAPTCGWSANANIDWLVVVSGASGTGSGTVSFSVATTTEAGDRTGTMTIAGQTFTVTQRHP